MTVFSLGVDLTDDGGTGAIMRDCGASVCIQRVLCTENGRTKVIY